MIVPSLPPGWWEQWLWYYRPSEVARGVMAWAVGYRDGSGRSFGRIRYFVRLWVVAAWVALLAVAVAAILMLALTPWSWIGVAVWALAPAVVTILVVRHERGHANGIPASGCVGGHRWCCMAEEAMVGAPEGWSAKLRLLPHQVLLGWGRYCRGCRRIVYARD